MTAKRILVLLFFLLLVLGCVGNRTIDAESLANAQQSYDSAIAELEAGNHEAALDLLDVALAPGGGLQADIYTDARVQRAICLARQGRCDEAHADLDLAAQGAADMATVHVARSFVFKMEDNDAESKSEMAAAKEINRRAKAIRE